MHLYTSESETTVLAIVAAAIVIALTLGPAIVRRLEKLARPVKDPRDQQRPTEQRGSGLK